MQFVAYDLNNFWITDRKKQILMHSFAVELLVDQTSAWSVISMKPGRVKLKKFEVPKVNTYCRRLDLIHLISYHTGCLIYDPYRAAVSG